MSWKHDAIRNEIFNRYQVKRSGLIIDRKTVQPCTIHWDRYAKVHIGLKGIGKFKMPIHRLVAECHIPNPNNYPQINHINGNKSDNSVKNLEWCTNSQNQIHAIDSGLKFARVRDKDYEKILELMNINTPRIVIASKYNISVPYLYKFIRTRRKKFSVPNSDALKKSLMN
jgi:hypothetical protein